MTESSRAVIRQLQKLEPGQRANRVLHELLLRPRFTNYWTFLEPLHEGTEIADVLVVWDDTAILFEAKTRGVRRPASEAWLHGKIQEAVSQLNDRAQMLNDGDVVLRNRWRGEMNFNPKRIKHLYGVIVLTGSFEPFEWRELASDAARRAKIPVQVFSLFDLGKLLRIFNTPIDLLLYYEVRAEYGRNHRLPVGQEVDTFQEVLGTWHDLWKSDSKRNSSCFLAALLYVGRLTG